MRVYRVLPVAVKLVVILRSEKGGAGGGWMVALLFISSSNVRVNVVDSILINVRCYSRRGNDEPSCNAARALSLFFAKNGEQDRQRKHKL